MSKTIYLSFVSVCLGLGDFYNLKEVIEYATDDAIASIMKILMAIFGKIVIDNDTRLPEAECTDFKIIEADSNGKAGFSIKIGNKTIKSFYDVNKINDEEIRGGAYVLFSDGMRFYKFYISNGETWEDNWLMTPSYFESDSED